jgi:hypothetical protein
MTERPRALTRRRRRMPAVGVILLVASAVGGCGLGDPYETDTTATSSPARSRDAASAPSRPRQAAGSPTPVAALHRYATIYINWTAETLPSNLRHLAAISTGAARTSALAAARLREHDRGLRRWHLHNEGAIIAITRGLGVERDRWVLVTRETTRGTGSYEGLPAGSAHLTLASVTHTGSGWIVSSWQPVS